MGEEDQLERDVTYCYYTNSQNSACWSGMLCATLVAMGSDVCGEPVGFKKVYVYNMKKNLSHIELCVCVVFACVCLLCLRVWTYTGLYIRVCGAQMWAAV